MPKYGIDYSKVEAKGHLASIRKDEVTAVTPEGANPSRAKSTRARRDAEPSTTTTRTRRQSSPKTVDTGESTSVTTETVSAESDNVERTTEVEDPNEGIDREPENADGDKV